MEGANGSERSGSGLGILALAAFHVNEEAVLASGGHDGLVRLWRIQAPAEVRHHAAIMMLPFRILLTAQQRDFLLLFAR
jgi:hypothetical protein